MRRPRQLSTAASCELLHCWCTDNNDRQDSLKEKLLTARRSSYCTRCTGTPTPSSPTISVHVKTSASLPAFCSKSSFTGDRRRIRGPSPSRSVPSEVGKWLRPSDVCDKSFATSGQLKTHKLTHSKEKPFKCEQCQKLFTQKTHLTRHLRTHTGEKPYTCTVCGKTFTEASNRNEHLKRCSSTANLH